MKSTAQRDIYADALTDFMTEVPIELWPMTASSLSRSGLERAMRSRGFSRFDRKRLLSSRCAPVLARMDAMLAEHLVKCPLPSVQESGESSGATILKDERRFRRRIEDLEKELSNAIRREKSYKERCALMEAQIEAMKLRRDAFEAHCETSLRTLHL